MDAGDFRGEHDRFRLLAGNTRRRILCQQSPFRGRALKRVLPVSAASGFAARKIELFYPAGLAELKEAQELCQALTLVFEFRTPSRQFLRFLVDFCDL